MKTLVFGEILWDKFPEKKELGGAPLNFACHFAQLGGKAYIISAVGDDEDGKVSVQKAQQYNVDTSLVATVPEVTGYCAVTLDEKGVPSYDLHYPVAYDMIPCPDNLPETDGVYFGTLALRGEANRKSFEKLMAKVSGKEVFFDINIRQKYYSKELLTKVLPYATVLKVSREEAPVFTELGIADGETPEILCKSLYEKYGFKQIIVTLDKDGAMVYDGNKFIYSKEAESNVVSTVGAGDSFSACYFYNYLRGKSPEACLDKAVTLSSYIVKILGAVCEYPDALKKELAE